jgi:hypothetical protein
MHSVLRTLREMQAKEPRDAGDPEPRAVPEEIERAVRE